MTQMTRIQGYHARWSVLILLSAAFLGAGLVLVGCGDDDTATTPAPPPPPPAPAPAPEPEPEPEPPAPEAPATPTGLMVSETTETSVTWTWNASEGALGYVVQANTDEMWDDADTVLFDGVPFTTGTTFTASDLPPQTAVFARVRAAAGTLEAPVFSDWTTHVSAMSDMPPPEPEPEPEPLAAIEVTFSLSEDADSQNFMVALDGDDEETAMAMVNTAIMVESNVTAIITPMFVENAAGVTVMAADNNMPFAYVDWRRLQADVVSDGATFMVQRATVGANQEMEPTGDVEYVTCGPFECAPGMDAPEVTIEDSMACTMWEPTLELQVGLIDNNLSSHEGAAYVADTRTDTTTGTARSVREVTVFDGLDLGWTYTSDLAFDVTHDLSVVSKTTKGVKEKSLATPMSVSSVGAITLGRGDGGAANQSTYYALSASPEDDALPAENRTTDALDVGSCQPVSSAGAEAGAALWAYNDNLASRISKPDNCFRITVDHGLERNYLDAYTVELDPIGADVAWGKIAWEAWENLTCPERTFAAAAEVDVCELFEAEVARLPVPTAEPIVIHSSLAAGGNLVEDQLTLAGFDFGYDFGDESSVRQRFASLWYLDDTTPGDKKDMLDLYYNDFFRDAATGNTGNDLLDRSLGAVGPALVEIEGARSLTGAGRFRATDADAANTSDDFRSLWIKTLDLDSDPIYGDLGKVSLDGDDEADNFVDSDDSRHCSADDGGSAATGKDGADSNSTLCDAHDVSIGTTVTFVPAMGEIGCDPITVSYTLTCDWAADGNMKNSVAPNPARSLLGQYSDFLRCSVEDE